MAKNYPIDFSVKFDAKASRLQLIVRFFVVIIWSIIAMIWGLVAFLASVVQWLHILFLGKRHKGIHDFVASFNRFQARLNGYAMLLTDEIPPLE